VATYFARLAARAAGPPPAIAPIRSPRREPEASDSAIDVTTEAADPLPDAAPPTQAVRPRIPRPLSPAIADPAFPRARREMDPPPPEHRMNQDGPRPNVVLSHPPGDADIRSSGDDLRSDAAVEPDRSGDDSRNDRGSPLAAPPQDLSSELASLALADRFMQAVMNRASARGDETVERFQPDEESRRSEGPGGSEERGTTLAPDPRPVTAPRRPDAPQLVIGHLRVELVPPAPAATHQQPVRVVHRDARPRAASSLPASHRFGLGQS
jgi:hypothetical protein